MRYEDYRTATIEELCRRYAMDEGDANSIADDVHEMQEDALSPAEAAFAFIYMLTTSVIEGPILGSTARRSPNPHAPAHPAPHGPAPGITGGSRPPR